MILQYIETTRREFVQRAVLSAAALSVRGRLFSQVSTPPASLPQNFSGTSSYLYEAVDGITLIEALEVELKADTLPPNDTIIFAYSARIQGPISLPGRNLRIHARKIVAEGNAVIDVSGAEADPMPSDRAQDGVNAGDPGSPGRRGNNGKNGGSIEILSEQFEGVLRIVSRGSDGKPGQNAGNGQKGQTGSPGTDQRNGGPGGNGGDGGAGGDGGNGGDGGSAVIYLVKGGRPTVSFDIAPGNGGAGAGGGTPGEGGAGGVGGRDVHSADLLGRRSVYGRPPGRKGAKGQLGPNGTRGQNGKASAGVLAASVRQVSGVQLASVASSRQLSMVLHAAELDYVNGDTEQATDKLAWILNMTLQQPPNELVPVESLVVVPGPVAERARLVKELEVIRERALILIQQLASGLDYYGRPYNFVELVDNEYYERYLGTLFTIGKAIEGRQEEFSKQKSAVELQRAALKSASSELKNTRQFHQGQVDQLGKSSDAIQDQIASLTTQLVDLRRSIEAAEQTFRSAVEGKAGCTLNDVLTVVEVVVSVAAAVYTGGASLVVTMAAFAEAAKATPEMIKAFDKQKLDKYKQDKNFINVLQKVGGEVSEIREGYNKIKSALKGSEDNSQKLLIDETDYERALQPYMDMPEARALKALLDSYVTTAKARNAACAEYTAVVLERDKMLNLMAEDQINLDRISISIAQANNPELYACAAFMDTALERLKVVIIRTLAVSKRALEFCNLAEVSLQFRDKTLAELESTFQKLKSDEVHLLEAQNRNAQKYNDSEIRIVDPVLLKQFQDFREVSLNIALDTSPFLPSMTNVRVSTVKVALEGVKTDTGWLAINVYHNGLSRFRTAARKQVDFTHRPRVNLWKYNYESGEEATSAEFGGSPGRFVDVSPFGLWSVKVVPAASPGIDLSKLKAIVFKFSGTFYSA